MNTCVYIGAVVGVESLSDTSVNVSWDALVIPGHPTLWCIVQCLNVARDKRKKKRWCFQALSHLLSLLALTHHSTTSSRCLPLWPDTGGREKQCGDKEVRYAARVTYADLSIVMIV